MKIILFFLTMVLVEGHAETRSEVSFQRGPYMMKFYEGYRKPWVHQSGIHAAHGGAHDLAHTTAPEDRTKKDSEFEAWMQKMIMAGNANNGPKMETYGPLASQFVWQLYRTIDWTHIHHEQTYDIMADKDIGPNEKKKWNDRAVKFYLENFDIPRSIAPLEVTLRRAGIMMKPYSTLFRNYFPKSNSLFWVAHWWHPAIYEALILGMRDNSQKEKVLAADHLLDQFFKGPPKRMLLSREMMPEYTRMNPMSANIFDNLHMLHGIAYDILTYEKWSAEEKKKELYRVIKAMAYQAGDEKYVRKFHYPREKIDPTMKENWMVTQEGSMSDIMMEMFMEMMPMMMPDISESQKKTVMEQFKLKMGPGMEPGEFEGSLHDALMKIVPDMKMNMEAMKPGEADEMMSKMMLEKWEKKNANM